MKLSERIRKERFRGGCAERAKDWADEVALLEAENESYQRLDEEGYAGLAVQLVDAERENEWMRREVERVGRALFTGTKTGHYVGTEEDLHSIGDFVEGVCEANTRLMSVEADNDALKRDFIGVHQLSQLSLIHI